MNPVDDAIITRFAEEVEAGDFDAADGWAKLAMHRRDAELYREAHK